MAIDRRRVLTGTIAAIAGLRLSATAHADIANASAAYAAATKRADGSYALALLSYNGAIVREISLSARGHDIAIECRTGAAVAFARRPGTFAVAFNVRQPRTPQIFTAPEGRHFFGHGAFSADGRLLYASENDIANGAGLVGIYDVALGFRRMGEFQSYGVGPHEIILLGDGRTLAIANGGIDTAPEAGRENLNLDAMTPSLAFVDATSGALLVKHALAADLNRLSIRHIAADACARVWFGGQWEGELANTPGLIGFASRDRSLQLMDTDAKLGPLLKGYIGSVAISADGTTLAASAPKAGRMLYVDAASGRVRGQSVMKDACGIAGESGDAFALTSGLGAFRHERPGADAISETILAEFAFDNHLRRVT